VPQAGGGSPKATAVYAIVRPIQNWSVCTKFTADVPHRYVVKGADDAAATLLVRYPRQDSNE
jgi:hypothetical protein